MPADLFQPLDLRGLTLPNRIVMAPMTRNRADEHGIASPMMVASYGQRATAGLIVTESSPISPEGVGYPYTPGIASDAQASVRSGAMDLVAFGAPFVANPDLVRRYRENLPLNEPDPTTFHTGGEAGYTDYGFHPTREAAAA